MPQVYHTNCRVCGIELTMQNCSLKRGTFRPECKACRNVQWKASRPPSFYKRRGDTCTLCDKPVTDEDFTCRLRGKRLAWCDECNRAKHRQARINDPEKVRQQERDAYYRNNKNEQQKERYQSSVARNTEYNTKRRIREHNAIVDRVSYTTILERDGWICCICHAPIDSTIPRKDPAGLTFEHDIPLSRSGPHSMTNIHPAHHVCNNRKYNKTLDELTPYDRRGL